MQYIIMAKDGDDAEALERRLDAREAHLAYGEEAAKRGEQIMAAALMDKDQKMRGSMMVVDFESVEDLKAWLDKEAYVTGKVWKDIDVIPCKLAPAFQGLIKKSLN